MIRSLDYVTETGERNASFSKDLVQHINIVSLVMSEDSVVSVPDRLLAGSYLLFGHVKKKSQFML